MYYATLCVSVLCGECKIPMRQNPDGTHRCVTTPCREFGRDYYPILPVVPMRPAHKMVPSGAMNRTGLTGGTSPT